MSDYEVEVLVRGRPVKVFEHKGNHFIEGRSGSAFELKVTNNTWDRIEVVGSVDGLSVTDGEECGPESIGYIVPPKESIVIPGWKLPNDKAAEFVFEDKRKSYSSQVGKGTHNVGVIGLMVFTEKVVAQPDPVIVPLPYPQPAPRNPWNPREPYITYTSDSTGNNPLRGMSKTISSNCVNEDIDGINCVLDSGDSYDLSDFIVGSSAGLADDGVVTETLSASSSEQPLFEIGTGWGDEIDHKVSNVEFERTDKYNPDEIISIFYDTRKGLEARGIQVIKTKKKKVSDLPNAFPTYKSSGCTPPPGWKGRK